MNKQLITRRSGLKTMVAGVALLGGYTALGITRAEAGADQTDLVQAAKTTLAEAQHDPQFGNSADLFKRARAVMVVPQLVKAGLFFGGEGGNAVLMTHSAGAWGNPLFYTIGSASFGLQIGVEVAEMVLFVMSEKALRAWTEDQVKLGAKAGLTVLVVGSNAEAAATTHGNVDVIAWAKSKGAYAGLTLEGSVIKPRNEWNQAYYGRPVTPSQMLKISAR
jgi:lipid-binding SYLF domain-containing protein